MPCTSWPQRPPDVFNHNLETVEPLYRNVRPGADYRWSLDLLARFKAQHPDIPTKSGIMLGLGETREQVEQGLRDLRAHQVDMVTIGQYLQPTAHHHPVLRYWTPEEFESLAAFGNALGFRPRGFGSAGPLFLSRRPERPRFGPVVGGRRSRRGPAAGRARASRIEPLHCKVGLKHA